MGLSVNARNSVGDAVGLDGAEATLQVVDPGRTSQKLLEFKAERSKLLPNADVFNSLSEKEKLKLLQVGYNLRKSQADVNALQILEKHLPAHLALSSMLDPLIVVAVRSDKTLLRGVFRASMAEFAGRSSDNALKRAISASGDLLWGLNFTLRGQAGLIGTLMKKSELFPIQQRAHISATIIELMQQKSLGGFTPQSLDEGGAGG